MKNSIYIKVLFGMLVLLVIFVINEILIIIKPYEAYYFEKIGIKKYNYTYSTMLKSFGEPINTQIINTLNNRLKVFYNDFTMSFWGNTYDSPLANVELLSNKYKFGKSLICIGSTKKEVDEAYNKVKRSPDDQYAFIDGDVYIQFFFNDNEEVNKILLFTYP